ncbi:MAG: S8 family serine peptidase [Cellvibrionaceae bacterium]
MALLMVKNFFHHIFVCSATLFVKFHIIVLFATFLTRRSCHILFLLALSLFIVSCGGGGGGDDGNGNSDSDPDPQTQPNPNPGPQPETPVLRLGAPSADPVVIPLSGAPTQVTFLSIVSGTTYPEALTLDEVDRVGNVVDSDIAQLKDDGQGADVYRGDRVYATTVMLGSSTSAERFYQVRFNNAGEEFLSGNSTFWVSECPARVRPSNAQQAVDDSRSDATIFANEVMITVEDGILPDLVAINAIAADVNGRVVGCIPALNQYLLEIEGDGSASGVYEAIDTLELRNEVQVATPNAQILDLPSSQPSTCSGRDCQWYLERIRASQAWSIGGAGDEQQSVAVIDFGVDCNHPELNCDGRIYNQDPIDHGTGVASVINGNNRDNTDFSGVAWNTDLYPFSFLTQSGSQYKMSELITRSLGRDNVKVINISAATAIDPNNQIRDAICGAISSGRLVVAAAGNASTSRSCEIDSIYPARYNTVSQCDNGADLQSGLLVVGATDINNDLAEWEGGSLCSNTLHVDLFAPGKDIYSASVVDNYAAKDGTSYATPIVAGSAAALWAARPELTVAEVHDQLKNLSGTLSRQSTDERVQTSDARVDGQPILDLYLAMGGDGNIDNPDVTPDVVSFSPQTGVPLNTLVTSEAVVISNIDVSTAIDIEGGFYSLDGAPFKSGAGSVSVGQSLRLQIMSSQSPATQSEARVTLGGITTVFQVTTEVPTNSRNDFNFFDQTNVDIGSEVVSNQLVIPDLDPGTPISVTGAEYSLDETGSFSSEDGIVGPTDPIILRIPTADTAGTTTTATIRIGNVEDTISLTTLPVDVSPRPFTLGADTDVDLNSEQESFFAVISQINTGAPISVSGGEYSIEGGEFTSEAGTVSNGQVIAVRHTTAATPGTTIYTALTVGDVTEVYQSTTSAPDTSPLSFSLEDRNVIATGTQLISNPVTVIGINVATPIRISGAEYRINGGSFTSAEGTVNNGDIVEVRLTASNTEATTVEAVLTIGNIDDTFSVSTVGANVPDTLILTDQTNVPVDSFIESNTLTIRELAEEETISITGGEYRLDGGSYTSATGTVRNNQTVQLRVLSSTNVATSTSATLTIGNMSDSFRVTTANIDTTPANFHFEDLNNIDISTLVTSNSITVSGINVPTPIGVNNGGYSINGGPFISSPGTVTNGDTVRLRLRSADTVETTVRASLTIGTALDTFFVTTEEGNNTPTAFSFTDQVDVPLNTLIESDSITVSGLNASTSIFSFRGEYSIDGGTFTNVPSIINNGQTVRVRTTSADIYDEERSVSVFVGAFVDTFSVRTIPPDTTPEPFSFDAQFDVNINSVVLSNTVTISGIDDDTSISIVGGEYSMNNGEDFLSTEFGIDNNTTVFIRQTTSSTNNTQKDTILTVGDFSATFSTTTAANQAPTVTEITIDDENGGDIVDGEVLTGSYIFVDLDGDLESTTSFRWLRNGAPITGATGLTYTVSTDDYDQVITFEVTPRAASGIEVGVPVTSAGITAGPSPTISSVRYLDVNRDSGPEGYVGDQLVIAFDAPMVINQQAADIFSLPVSGDSLGSDYSLSAGPLQNEITITFEASVSPRNLRLAEFFDPNVVAAGSPSGIGLSDPVLPDSIESVSGIDAVASTPTDIVAGFVGTELYTSGTNIIADIDAVDLNNDTTLDMFLGSNAESGIAFAQTNKTFTEIADAISLVVTSDELQEGILGDIDGDNDIDYIASYKDGSQPVTSNAGTVRLFLNDGSGQYTYSGQSLGANFGIGLSFYDIDGDNDQDLLFLTAPYAEISVWVNDGSGNFTINDLLAISPSESVGRYSRFTFGDIDNDTDEDIALFEEGGRHRIGINDGNNSYSFGAVINDFLGDSTSPVDGDLSFFDVDQDGDLDLFESIISSTGSRRMWYINDDNVLVIVPFVAPNAYQLTPADMNGDGWTDLVESGNMSDLAIYFNNGNTGYPEEDRLFVHAGNDDIRNLTLKDIDNDGDIDIIFSPSGTGTTWIYYNSQTGDQDGLPISGQ